MKVFRSIKWQLQIWQMLLLAGVLATLLSLHYHLRKTELLSQTDKELQNALVTTLPGIAPMMEAGGDPRPFDRPGFREPGRQDPPRLRDQDQARQNSEEFLKNTAENQFYVATWNRDGRDNIRHGDVPDTLQFSTIEPPEKGERKIITRDRYRELIQLQPGGLLIVIGHPLDDLYATLATTRKQLWLVGSVVWLIGFFGGLLIIGKTMHPIREISGTAEQIASGDRSRRIELSDAPDELAGLAYTLNDTFDHLDKAIETQKRFSADASHELRTPIAVVIAQTQAALKRDRSTEEYKAVLEACQRAGKRMKSMADSLLTLTRIDSQGNTLSKTCCDLNTVLSGAVDSASLLSEKHPVDFHGTDHPFMADIDTERIHQVVTNLLANAIQHNPEDCALHVSLLEQNGNAVIDITDAGTGIAAEHLPHIFDRFYRIDKSRSREHGGAGLGLSIVQSLVEAHGGTITVQSEPGRGTTFTITLPLS